MKRADDEQNPEEQAVFRLLSFFDHGWPVMRDWIHDFRSTMRRCFGLTDVPPTMRGTSISRRFREP